MNKSIPELQIELNDLKRKGCTPEELDEWICDKGNKYRFASNTMFLFLTKTKPESFSLVLAKASNPINIKTHWLKPMAIQYEFEEIKAYAVKYANFIKDLMNYERLAILSERFSLTGSDVGEFYGEYLLV